MFCCYCLKNNQWRSICFALIGFALIKRYHLHMCNRALLLFGKLLQWNLHVNCHVNGTFQNGLGFQTSLSSLGLSCKRALKKQNIECLIFYNNVYFFKTWVRPVNRFFNSKLISWYFLLILPLCIALLGKATPRSNSCSNVYLLQQCLLIICENQLYYVAFWRSSVRLLLD